MYALIGINKDCGDQIYVVSFLTRTDQNKENVHHVRTSADKKYVSYMYQYVSYLSCSGVPPKFRQFPELLAIEPRIYVYNKFVTHALFVRLFVLHLFELINEPLQW